MYKVMIVDDELLVRTGIKALIKWKKLGFEIVAEASNGISAYEKYVAFKPDVVITDIKMPKKDGLWLTEKIKEDNPDTEVIMLTCYDDFIYMKQAIKYKVSDYILKAEMEEEELTKIMLGKKKKLDKKRNKSNDNSSEGDKLLMKNRQEYLLGLLLSSNRSINIIKQEFTKAQYEWDTKSYCFLQFDFGSSFKNERLDIKVSNIINVCMELIEYKFKDEGANILTKQFAKSVTCFVMAENLNDIKIQRWIDHLHDTIMQYFNLNFKSISTPIKNTIEEAREYLEWLYEASDYLFYITNGGHLTINNINKNEKCNFTYNMEMIKEFCRGIENADIKALEKLLDEIENELIEQKGHSIEVKLELSHMLKDIFDRIDLDFEDSQDSFKIKKKILQAEELKETMSIFKEFLIYAINTNDKNRYDTSQITIKKAEQYIDDNYNNRITLDEISEYVGISKYYFSALFKKETGNTFSNYLNTVRIEKAKQMIKDPKVTISDVAFEVGFNDYTYFCKTFKKFTGMTATEYRNKITRT